MIRAHEEWSFAADGLAAVARRLDRDDVCPATSSAQCLLAKVERKGEGRWKREVQRIRNPVVTRKLLLARGLEVEDSREWSPTGVVATTHRSGLIGHELSVRQPDRRSSSEVAHHPSLVRPPGVQLREPYPGIVLRSLARPYVEKPDTRLFVRGITRPRVVAGREHRERARLTVQREIALRHGTGNPELDARTADRAAEEPLRRGRVVRRARGLYRDLDRDDPGDGTHERGGAAWDEHAHGVSAPGSIDRPRLVEALALRIEGRQGCAGDHQLPSGVDRGGRGTVPARQKPRDHAGAGRLASYPR